MDELQEYLVATPILSTLGFDQHGAHNSFLLILEGGVGVLAKPADEIGDGDRLVRREVAAWMIARLLGWDDLLGATVLRDIPSHANPGTDVSASLQVLWPLPERIPPATAFSDEEIWRAAVFDAVVCHTDRNNNNWLGVPRADTGVTSRLRLVDHGYGFTPGLTPPGSSFYQLRSGQPLPAPTIASLQALSAALPGNLAGLLIADEVQGVHMRVERLLAAATLTLP